jgi:hypothetical protein
LFSGACVCSCVNKERVAWSSAKNKIKKSENKTEQIEVKIKKQKTRSGIPERV